MSNTVNIKCNIIPVSMQRIEDVGLEMLFNVSVNKNEMFFYFNKNLYGKTQDELNSLADISQNIIFKMIELGFLFENILVRTDHIISVGVTLNKSKTKINNVAVNMPQSFFSEDEISNFVGFFYEALTGEKA